MVEKENLDQQHTQVPDNYKKNNSNLSDLTKSASKIESLKSRVNSSSSSKISAGGSVGKSLMVTK